MGTKNKLVGKMVTLKFGEIQQINATWPCICCLASRVVLINNAFVLPFLAADMAYNRYSIILYQLNELDFSIIIG